MNIKKIIQESIRGEYEQHGVDGYYQYHGNEYKNPHEDRLQHAMDWIIENWSVDFSNTLDMSAGSGEMTKMLTNHGYDNVEGSDPYTCTLYTRETGKYCHDVSFDEIMGNGISKKYSTIICSYALHLADTSKLPQIIWQISQSCKNFIILSPTKKPEIKDDWGMSLVNSGNVNSVKIRHYQPNS
jgi:hypothetical protein